MCVVLSYALVEPRQVLLRRPLVLASIRASINLNILSIASSRIQTSFISPVESLFRFLAREIVYRGIGRWLISTELLRVLHMDCFFLGFWQFVKEPLCELEDIVADTSGDSVSFDIEKAHSGAGVVYFVGY